MAFGSSVLTHKKEQQIKIAGEFKPTVDCLCAIRRGFVAVYAATKKSNELMAHAYSKLYNIPSTGLRFFTVYGPAGRPDMAYFGFTNKLLKGETIQIFNYGNCKRDFTYVDDIVEGVVRVMQGAPERKNGEDGLPVPPYKK